MTQITDHLARVKRRVESALREAGRQPDAATILAVSKGHPAAAIEAAYQAGQRRFGENFVQEALAKMDRVDHSDIEWHFIGHVQSNKTRDITEQFDWVHTVDRLKIANRLSEQRRHHAVPLQVCIQVNQAGEPQKGGVAESEVEALARAIIELPRLRLRGLMTIPPLLAEPSEYEALFARLRSMKEHLGAEGIPLDTLSMGMSSDLEAAVRQGSTIVRVGTAIFGPRPRVARR